MSEAPHLLALILFSALLAWLSNNCKAFVLTKSASSPSSSSSSVVDDDLFWLFQLHCHPPSTPALGEDDDDSKQHNVNQWDIPILYEDDRLLVVNKPSGISHHNHGDELGIVSYLQQQQPQTIRNNDNNNNTKLYGVHRLDRVTSGILLLAKDAQMASELSEKFRHQEVTKYYAGISAKKATQKKQGWVKGEMQRGRRKSWMLKRRKTNNDERERRETNNEGALEAAAQKRTKTKTTQSLAVTRFFTCGLGATTASLSSPPPKTCILFRPYTGKTHQLRVAAKSVGLPLYGDPTYRDGLSSLSDATSSTTSTSRTCLHAMAIHIESLSSTGGQPLTIWCYPEFANVFGYDDDEPFRTAFSKLIHKHCDTPALLERFDWW